MMDTRFAATPSLADPALLYGSVLKQVDKPALEAGGIASGEERIFRAGSIPVRPTPIIVHRRPVNQADFTGSR